MAGAARRLRQAVASVEGRQVVLVGHSFGAAVVLEALCQGIGAAGAILISGFDSGQMVRRGIKARTESFPPDFHERYRNGKGVSQEEISALLADYWFPSYFCRVPFTESLKTGLAGADREYMFHFLGPDLFNLSGELTKWDRSKDLKRIRVPVLMLSGEYDYFCSGDLERMCSNIPSAQLRVISLSSHNCWIEEPAASFAAIEAFVRRLETESA